MQRDKPRIAVLSLVRAHNEPFWAAVDEVERVLIEALEADVFTVALRSGTLRTKVARSGRLGRLHPSSFVNLTPLPADRYDLLIVLAQSPLDLAILRIDRSWLDLAPVRIAQYWELWPHDAIKHREGLTQVLRYFDVVLAGFPIAVPALVGRIACEVRPTPFPIDALAFTRNQPERVIDVTTIGRRAVLQHETLTAYCDATSRFMSADTGTLANVWNQAQHRHQLINQLIRSKVFVANFARVDQPEVSRGHRLLGGRHIEGLAAGCVMIGARPDNSAEFIEHIEPIGGFIDMSANADSVPPRLDELLRDDQQRSAIHRRHQILALKRHDVSSVWLPELERLGYHSTGLLARQAQVAARINQLTAGVPTAGSA